MTLYVLDNGGEYSDWSMALVETTAPREDVLALIAGTEWNLILSAEGIAWLGASHTRMTLWGLVLNLGAQWQPPTQDLVARSDAADEMREWLDAAEKRRKEREAARIERLATKGAEPEHTYLGDGKPFVEPKPRDKDTTKAAIKRLRGD
jgi:hypothetical protein